MAILQCKLGTTASLNDERGWPDIKTASSLYFYCRKRYTWNEAHESVRDPVTRTTSAGDRFVADLHAQGIEEHDRIHQLERSRLPAVTSAPTASVTLLIKSGETSTPYISPRNA